MGEAIIFKRGIRAKLGHASMLIVSPFKSDSFFLSPLFPNLIHASVHVNYHIVTFQILP